MADRRTFIAGAAVLAGMAVSGISRALAASPGTRLTQLQTRLFNFRDDVTPQQAEAAIRLFKEHAAAAGIGSMMVGRNYVPIQFPTRFEWIYILEMPDAVAQATPAYADFRQTLERLGSLCRNQVQCDLACALPDHFAAAPGVGVRHTVMFSFKPGTPQAIRDKIVNDIRQMGQLPTVRAYLVEPCRTPTIGPDEMEWQVIGDYASVADYRAYADAPVHLAIREDFTRNTARVAFLDTMV
jgi:hypothetical protein